MELELNGRRYPLDTAAVSALRYRAAYGESVVEALRRPMPPRKREGVLLRMCHLMIPAARRPPLLELAEQARRDGDFPAKGRVARDALLAGDRALEGWEDGEPGDGAPFDEYRLLAALVLAGVDPALLYELPLLHLLGLLKRLAALRDPERKTYRRLTGAEMAQLYPRPRKKRRSEGERHEV